MLARQLGIEVPTNMPDVPSRTADWCAHGFTFGRRRWLIFCNTATLYPVCAHARGVTNGEALMRRLVGTVQHVLGENGFSVHMKRLAGEVRTVQWAPIPDRSVLGSMNDLIYLAGARLDDPDLTPSALSYLLGRTPMSALGMNHPTAAFASLQS